MYTISVGDYLYTFANHGRVPACCQMSQGSEWITNRPAAFPQSVPLPIQGAVGLDESLVVIDANSQLWHCGTNDGAQWVQDITQPNGFTIASFLAAGDSYIAAHDESGDVYLISTPGGQWVPAQNLIPLV